MPSNAVCEVSGRKLDQSDLHAAMRLELEEIDAFKVATICAVSTARSIATKRVHTTRCRRSKTGYRGGAPHTCQASQQEHLAADKARYQEWLEGAMVSVRLKEAPSYFQGLKLQKRDITSIEPNFGKKSRT